VLVRDATKRLFSLFAAYRVTLTGNTASRTIVGTDTRHHRGKPDGFTIRATFQATRVQ